MSILVLKMRSYELLNLTLRHNLFDSFFQCLSAQSMYMNIILLCFNLFIPGECSDITDVTKFDFPSNPFELCALTLFVCVHDCSVRVEYQYNHSAYPVSCKDMCVSSPLLHASCHPAPI